MSMGTSKPSRQFFKIRYCYPDHCTSAMTPDVQFAKGFFHQEWQSAAAAEGFADFYMMTVWNELGHSSCGISSTATIRSHRRRHALAFRILERRISLARCRFQQRLVGRLRGVRKSASDAGWG